MLFDHRRGMEGFPWGGDWKGQWGWEDSLTKNSHCIGVKLHGGLVWPPWLFIHPWVPSGKYLNLSGLYLPYLLNGGNSPCLIGQCKESMR